MARSPGATCASSGNDSDPSRKQGLRLRMKEAEREIAPPLLVPVRRAVSPERARLLSRRFSESHLELQGLVAADDAQGDLITGLVRVQRVQVRVGLIQGGATHTGDDIAALKAGIAAGTPRGHATDVRAPLGRQTIGAGAGRRDGLVGDAHEWMGEVALIDYLRGHCLRGVDGDGKAETLSHGAISADRKSTRL